MSEIDERLDTASLPTKVVRRARTARAALSPATASAVLPAPSQPWAKRYRMRLRITDGAVVLVAVGLSYLLRFAAPSGSLPDHGAAVLYAPLSLLVIVVWRLALGACHTYDPRVIGTGVGEYRRIVGASTMAFGLLGIGFVVAEIDLVRGYFVLAYPVGLAGLLIGRWAWRKWLIAQRVNERFVSRALVVGDADAVLYVTRQIQSTPATSYNIVGAAVTGETTGAVLTEGRPVPILSGSDAAAEAARAVRADAVIVAGQPQGRPDYIRSLSWQLEGTATELVLASRLVDVAGPRIHFRPVEGLPLIHVEIPQFEGGKHILKRALDIAASAAALIVLSPLFVVLALIVRLEDGGPAFFSQTRVGRNGGEFRMYKFRSMVTDAERVLETLSGRNDGNGILFKMRHDPRVTRVGRVLRKYSLDELPQLWNVLVGDMSLVGPRPPLISEAEAYEEHVRRRLYIKPGLTGMWQINGRSDLGWDESVRLDLYYVENWSLTGDLVIMWRTLKVLLRPTGAY